MPPLYPIIYKGDIAWIQKDRGHDFHYVSPHIHLLDAEYNEIDNYNFAQKQGANPLIDYDLPKICVASAMPDLNLNCYLSGGG